MQRRGVWLGAARGGVDPKWIHGYKKWPEKGAVTVVGPPPPATERLFTAASSFPSGTAGK